MILTLELILLIVYGVFCFALVKGAEHTNKNLKERNVHLMKRLRIAADETDRLHYESDKFSAELDERNTQIEALSRELMAAESDKKQLLGRVGELKEENLALSLRLQKMGKKEMC